MAKTVSAKWQSVDRKMLVRRGRGPWIQVRIPQPDGSEKFFVMREVKGFVEQPKNAVEV